MQTFFILQKIILVAFILIMVILLIMYIFFAICKYQNDDVYYLFTCNENYEVVGDSIWNSIEDCIKIASSSYDGNLLWIDIDIQ